MGRPSKFTADRKEKILKALTVGSSRRTAAAIAGVDEATLRTWIGRGRKARAGSSYHEFAEAVDEAEAHPKARALGIIYDAMEERPDLAWKFLERREHGFAPPQTNVTAPPAGPVVIQLHLSDGQTPVLVPNEVEGEIVDEQHGLPNPAPRQSA